MTGNYWTDLAIGLGIYALMGAATIAICYIEGRIRRHNAHN